MATAAPSIANQTSTQRSTGPRAEANTSQVAEKPSPVRHSIGRGGAHGLSAKHVVILSGQDEAFASLQSALETEFQPEGAYQHLLFRQLLHASWTLERCWAAEAQLLATAADPTIDPLLVDANANRLRLIALYAKSAERSRAQAAKELRRVQTELRYRLESADPATATCSPLVDTQELDKRVIANTARQQQAALNQIRALCEAPNPAQFAEKTGPDAVPGQTKPMGIADLLVMKPAGHR